MEINNVDAILEAAREGARYPPEFYSFSAFTETSASVHVGETWDRRYEDDRKRPVKVVREVCALCGWPIALKHPWSACEFASQPRLWWRDDRPDFCHCNGCLCPPTGSMGRPKYCGDECRHRVKLAWERGHRRAEGATSWSFDVEADRLVNYRMDIKELVRQRRASGHYPRW